MALLSAIPRRFTRKEICDLATEGIRQEDDRTERNVAATLDLKQALPRHTGAVGESLSR